jgi:hypothetical protein
MKMPNPGKPAEIKKLIGSRNYRPGENVMTMEQTGVIPEPIRQLGESGMDLWVRVWSMGLTWIHRASDIHLLQITCEQIDERDSLREVVMDNPDSWHERAGLRALEKDLVSNLSQLGFTPTARMKLGVGEVKLQSKLQELMDAKARGE